MDNGVVEGSCPSLALGAESCTTAEALGAAGCTQGVEAIYLVVPGSGTDALTSDVRGVAPERSAPHLILLLKPIIIIEDSYIECIPISVRSSRPVIAFRDGENGPPPISAFSADFSRPLCSRGCPDARP